MPATKRKTPLPSAVKKIQASQLINALQNHALGKNTMSATQISAAAILIRKVIPDLAAIQLDANIEHDIQIRWRK